MILAARQSYLINSLKYPRNSVYPLPQGDCFDIVFPDMGLGIRTFLRNKLREYRSTKFGGDYVDWRAKRQIAIVDHYGIHFFRGKSVLELGAGYGGIGAVFAGVGAQVTCVEGREKNTRVIRERYPHLDAHTFDLSTGWPKPNGHYDVIIHFGVLYHLRNPEENLRAACRHGTHLILETEVCNSDDPNKLVLVNEASYCFDQAVDGV